MGWEMGGEGAGVKSWGGYDIGGEGIISKKAAYVPGGKEICGCDFITLDNPEHCFLLGHLGVCTHGGSKGGGCSDVWVSSSKQLAGACQPWPTMPSSKTGSEYWIDGSHRETALEDFYVVGPELGRYWLPGGGSAGADGGRSPPCTGMCPEWGWDWPGGERKGWMGGWRDGWEWGMEGDPVLTCKLVLGICHDAAAVVLGMLTEVLQDGARVPCGCGAACFSPLGWRAGSWRDPSAP